MPNTWSDSPAIESELPRAKLQSVSYSRTRAAWRRIWMEEASLTEELATLEYPRSKSVFTRYRRYLPTGDRVLEAGCGFGIELVRLENAVSDTIGVDYVELPLRAHRQKYPARLLAVADIHELPFESNSFGSYLSFGVLEHFSFGPEPALVDAFRVLKPGGTLILTVPASNLFQRAVAWRRRRRGPSTGGAGTYFETTYSANQMGAIVERIGFEVVKVHPIGHSFTLWGLGGFFRGSGYYRTTLAAELLGAFFQRVAPWSTAFAILLIARKVTSRTTGELASGQGAV